MTARPHTVLLVDDEPGVLRALVRSLRSQGYRLLTAEDPHEALRLLEDDDVDLLISDIDMPYMDGVELVKLVRRKYPDVVRMLITGDASLESAIQAINDGEVHRYLLKPWRAAELRAILREAVNRLDALRAASAAHREATIREELMIELEREHPGIRSVAVADGVYRIDVDRLSQVAASMLPETAKPLFVSGSPAPTGQHKPDTEDA